MKTLLCWFKVCHSRRSEARPGIQKQKKLDSGFPSTFARGTESLDQLGMVSESNPRSRTCRRNDQYSAKLSTAALEKGFTLLELLVVVGISFVITVAMFMAVRLGNEQMDTADLKMTIQDSAREGLYKMIQEIRESAPARITIAGGGTSIQFTVPDPNNPVLTANYNVNWAGAHTIQYDLNGSQIRRRNLTTAQTSVMASDVTRLAFTANAPQPTVVTVSMNVQRTLKNNRVVPDVALQITGQAKVRNP